MVKNYKVLGVIEILRNEDIQFEGW